MASILFANNDNEAKSRAAKYAKSDPFPSVPVALLSSAEIYDYARVTGMIFPFDAECLKSASYEAHVSGKFIMWTAKGDREEQDVKKGEKIVLPANSIAFVQVEPQFRLPDYIALRFNLRITHVHRGLLLGTGPLVDPGFHGRLLIPLHNLTASDYEIDTNKALIWIEFTKTTFGFDDFSNSDLDPTRPRPYRGFPDDKKNLEPETYLHKANKSNPIRSSIPDVIESSENEAKLASDRAKNAEESAQNAQNAAEGIRKQATRIGFISLFVLVVATATLLYQIFSLVQDTQSLVLDATHETNQLTQLSELGVLKEEIANLSEHIADLAGRNDELGGKLGKISEEVGDLRESNVITERQLDETSGQLSAMAQRSVEFARKLTEIENRLGNFEESFRTKTK